MNQAAMSESDAIQNMFTAGSLTAFLIMLLIMYLRRDEFSWKNGSKRFWIGYLDMMVTRFHNTPPKKQDEYILRMAQIVTIGSVALVLSFFYPFLPTVSRVFVLPVTLVLAWFIGSYLARRRK